MFKSAATKIAHNSTLPSLALSGNKDLRPLQDLITAEKVVLITLQKLSVDFAKAGETLRIWGAGEGEDLGDILGASTTILAHFSAALTGYATREHAIRDHLKAIRTREEALDELKRRRKALLARADSAEKKLNKMGGEHKNLAAQTDLLSGLQTQIRGMDSEIMTEEAALSDFKRSSARTLMGLKFGGLLEACGKGCVVGEVGRVVVGEISEETTLPGLARPMYMGHARTEARVAEAERRVNDIVFAPLPASAADGENNDPGNQGAAMGGMGGFDNNDNNSYNSYNTGGGLTAVGLHNTGVSGMSVDSGVGSGFFPPPPGAGSAFLPPPDVGRGLMDGGVSPGSAYAPPAGSPPGGYGPSAAGGYNASAPGGYNTSAPGGTYSAPGGYSGMPGGTDASDARDDLGVGMGGISGVDVGGTEGPGGGRFATFPVRGRGYSLRDDGGSGGQSAQQGDSSSLGFAGRKDTTGSDFMAAVLTAGEFGAGKEREMGSGSTFSQQGQGSQFSQPGSQFSQPGSQFSPAFSAKQQERERERERLQQQQQHEDEPAPEYRDFEPTSHSQVYEYPNGGVQGPPPGAAPPIVGGVWVDSGNNNNNDNSNNTYMTGIGSGRRGTSGLAVEEGGGDRQSTVSEDIGLAYMNMGDPPEENEREREARLSKHVRFGDEDSFVEPEPPYMKREPSSASAGSRTRRVPPPTMDPVEDERALNAAAAREVSRELDALNFSAPPLPQVQVQEEGGGWEYSSAGKEQSPSRELPAKREYGSPPKRDYAPSPQSQYATPTGPSPAPFTSPPPPAKESSYAPPPNREPSPLIPPVAPFSRKDSTPGHQSTPSWDASPVPPPAQPAPFVAGHHTTPSWALTPAPPADSPVSPSSPRLETPYRAPIAARSTSSLNTQPPPGARTISAAAFRRPQKAPSSGDLVADTSPLSLKKRLPASPYPQQRTGSTLRDASQPQGAGQQQQQQAPPQEDDAPFDYISAYTNGGRDSQAFHDDGSPMQADFDYGRLGKVEVVGGLPTSPGYSEGRFATDLDHDNIR